MHLKIFRMNRLGIPQERIAKRLLSPQQTISGHLPKMPLLANPVNTDLSRGFTVAQVAEKHGWTQEQIVEVVGVNQQRVSQITNNANFGKIGNLVSQGRDMDYIAMHYHMDLALAWALRLEGRTDC